MSNAPPSEARLTGTATYRERIALPADAVFEATLEDVTRADAPAEVIGRTRMDSPGNPPFKFEIAYDPACNRMMGSYTLVGSKLTFSQIAGTMMACPEGMDVERAFHTALGRDATWRS